MEHEWTAGQQARLTRKYWPPETGLSPGDVVTVVQVGEWTDISTCITVEHPTAGKVFCDPDELEVCDG
jgi:hypothetical protein